MSRRDLGSSSYVEGLGSNGGFRDRIWGIISVLLGLRDVIDVGCLVINLEEYGEVGPILEELYVVYCHYCATKSRICTVGISDRFYDCGCSTWSWKPEERNTLVRGWILESACDVLGKSMSGIGIVSCLTLHSSK